MRESNTILLEGVGIVRSTLNAQLIRVNEEISKSSEKIEEIKEHIMGLEAERAALVNSIKIMWNKFKTADPPIAPDEDEKDPDDENILAKEKNIIDVKLTQKLVNMMVENNPKSSIINRLTPLRQADWINSCRLMRERDKRTQEEIDAMIEFSQNHSFWKANILSMPKLREKFDQLWLQAKKENYDGIKEWLNDQEEETIEDPF